MTAIKKIVFGLIAVSAIMVFVSFAMAQGVRQAVSPDPDVMCQAIELADMRDLCYLQYAVSRNQKEWCGKIVATEQSQSCFKSLESRDQKLDPILWSLGASPDALLIGQSSKVFFSTSQSGSEEKASKVVLEELGLSDEVVREVGALNDDGQNGDLSAGDYVYGGTFQIFGQGEGQLRFRARAVYAQGSRQTEVFLLPVTRFPVGSAGGPVDKIILDRQGNKVLADQVIVGIKQGVPPERIEQIVQEAGGKVIGAILALRTFQIRIPEAKKFTALEEVLKKFQQYPEVEYAEPNGVTDIDSGADNKEMLL